MGYKLNPFTGNLDATDSPNGVFEAVEVNGDITLDDGGTYATTLQLITPTANRTISFPDATGTVGLVGGSSGQLVYNNAGLYAGAPSTSVGATGDITLSLNGAADTPPLKLTGTWFSGGTSTTTKPQLLIEPTGTTSTAWSTGGTGLGVNAASGFGGNLLDLQVNGTSRVVATSAGLVGIGTSSPSSLLSLYAGASSEYFRGGGNGVTTRDLVLSASTGTNAGDTHTINASGSSGQLILATASSERVRIDNLGRVGIGTSSVVAKLDVAESITAGTAISRSNSQINILSGTGAGTDYRSNLFFSPFNTSGNGSPAAISAIASGNTSSTLAFYTNPDNQYSGTPVERMRIDSSGRLLVGTSSAPPSTSVFAGRSDGGDSPVVRLDTKNSALADAEQLGALYFGTTADNAFNSGARIVARRDGGTWTANTSTPTRLEFSTTADGASSPTERMRIDNKGSTGVYAETGSGIRACNQAAAGTIHANFIGRHSASSTTTGTNSFIVWTNGDVVNTNNSYAGISDIKLKENIVDASSQWDDIKALRPVNYNFKAETGFGTHTQIGLVAQEVEPISPGLVSESPDRDEDGNELGTTTKSVNYSVLYMKAVKALQEAMERIETLEANNTDLLARVTALESA